MPSMGFDFGLGTLNSSYKQKFRWLFKIPGVSAVGVDSLPPQKSARPALSFKEMEAQHLSETIYFPGKPEWKPINLTLYDLPCREHPVFKWLKKYYDPENGDVKTPLSISIADSLKTECTLELYSGCGDIVEKWVFENAWPQNIDFGELDMGTSDVVTVDFTLRYDRAFIV